LHNEICQWMIWVRLLFPGHFVTGRILDVGSLDINGNNRYLFGATAQYEGIDIVAGPNVNHVGYMHEWAPGRPAESYDVVISTDCLEHDKYWRETLKDMVRLLRGGGLMAWTCAGEGRDEHGTTRLNPYASPGTHDYYGNITPEMVRQQVFAPEDIFSAWDFNCCTNTMGPGLDTRFWGVKKRKVEA